MRVCQEIGRWITESVEQPLERFFTQAYQVCSEVRRWVEREIRTPIETWREQEEKRCREQECNWLCLCCNKWFCWIVTILVRIIEWVIQVVGEWLVEVVCNIIVTVIRVIVMVIVQIVKWVVLAVVCFIESFCAIFILTGALALLGALLGIAALGAPALAAAAAPAIPGLLVIAAATLLLARLLCEVGWCRVIGAVGWALKWAIVLGAAMTIAQRAPLSALVVAVYGGLIAALYIALRGGQCQVPTMLGPP